MQYCRFISEDGPQFGQVETREGELWVTALISATGAFETESKAEFEPRKISELKLLVPVAPAKTICVGRNYRDHAKELGNEVPADPLLFFKPPSSLLAPGGVIEMPAVAERVDFEGELALVIGKRASKLKAGANWREYVRGYTLAND